MNLGDARQLFTEAERIADKHGLHLLARTISTEHDKLLEQLEKWQDLGKIKAPISERLKFVEIDKTLNIISIAEGILFWIFWAIIFMALV